MNRLIGMLLLSSTTCFAQQAQMKPEATEDWSWKPPVVRPAKSRGAPSDALVLYNGKTDLDKWQSVDGTPVRWQTKGKVLQIVRKGKSIETKQPFGSVQLHIEWRTPDPKEDRSTSRGNSGVLFMGLYELQIYESYDYNTKLYYNGIAGSVYKQYIPLANAARPPKLWQYYDVIFEAPVFSADGQLEKPAYMTVFWNGVLVQNHVALKGPMTYQGIPEYKAHAAKLPLQLQEHSSRVSFRNIWVRPL